MTSRGMDVSMDRLAEGKIQLVVHSAGPSLDDDDTGVSAAVFAQKLGQLVAALGAADEAVNGSRVHEYTIARLHTSTPTAILRERPRESGQFDEWRLESGIEAFASCASAIATGESDAVQRFGKCAEKVLTLTKGAGRRFGFMEATVADNVIRIDPFLSERAATIVSPKPLALASDAQKWFKGVTEGSFVGSVKEADLRGALPEIKLVLSAGGKEIDCVCRGLPIDDIRAALDRRVRITGRALYDGKSGLPRRVEVRSIEHFKTEVDFKRWSGGFEPFEAVEWFEGEH